MADPSADMQVGRRAVRRKLFQPAELRHGAAVQRIHLLDLSTAGGQAHAATPPAHSSNVTLVCGSLVRTARIAWVSGQRFGLTFLLPLTDAEVAAIVGVRTGT